MHLCVFNWSLRKIFTKSFRCHDGTRLCIFVFLFFYIFVFLYYLYFLYFVLCICVFVYVFVIEIKALVTVACSRCGDGRGSYRSSNHTALPTNQSAAGD